MFCIEVGGVRFASLKIVTLMLLLNLVRYILGLLLRNPNSLVPLPQIILVNLEVSHDVGVEIGLIFQQLELHGHLIRALVLNYQLFDFSDPVQVSDVVQEPFIPPMKQLFIKKLPAHLPKLGKHLDFVL